MACGRQHYKACGRRHKGQALLARGLNSLHAAYTNDLDGLEQAEVTDENHEPFAIFLLDEKPQMLQDGPQMLIAGPVAIIPLGVLEKGERASDRRGQ